METHFPKLSPADSLVSLATTKAGFADGFVYFLVTISDLHLNDPQHALEDVIMAHDMHIE